MFFFGKVIEFCGGFNISKDELFYINNLSFILI